MSKEYSIKKYIMIPYILKILFLSTYILQTLPKILCDEHTHRYKNDEEIVLWMNTVGPYVNHQETYNYYSLPFCRGIKKDISHYHETIMAEAIQGVELEFSGFDIRFKVDVPEKKDLCSKVLTKDEAERFKYAVKNFYSFQMYLDDLPIEGLIGDYSVQQNSERFILYPHKRLDIGYNGDRIVEINTTTNIFEFDIVPDVPINFTYSIYWHKSNIEFSNRFNKYLDPAVFKPRIHWFSIFNSFMLVIFLIGLVSMILMGTLRKDYARYSREDFDDIDRDFGEEYGWKQIHADVFRQPRYPLLLSSFVGTGHHIAISTFFIIVFTMMGDLYMERASILSVGMYTYSLLSFVNGFFGGSLYSQLNGRNWIKQCLFSAAFLPIVACGIAFLINFIAMYYHSARAIPFVTMLSVMGLCIFIILPLTLVGTIVGKNIRGHISYPCRTVSVPRPIPEKKWYMEPSIIIFLGGILPFGSISIEMYFIFTSFWTYQIYYVYGFMLLVFLIAISVTVCVTIVCTYMLLNSEDYRWQWTSFLTGASTAFYVYLYSFYYFFFKTKMYGLFQTAFYFGYMALFSLAIGLMSGSIGYTGTSAFVRKIYSTIKVD